MKSNLHPKRGFTLVEMLVVVAVIGLLASIAIPCFVYARTTSQTKGCVENIRTLWGAQQQWAVDHQPIVSSTVLVTSDIVKYLGGDTMPSCPANGSYTIGNADAMPYCSLQAHKDAAQAAGYK